LRQQQLDAFVIGAVALAVRTAEPAVPTDEEEY
jgi:hypothetical protein